MWMLIFLLLPIMGIVYASWHVYVLLPLPALWRWVVIGVGVASFLTMFLNLSRAIDTMPLPVARWCYDIGSSSIFVLLYLVIIFLGLDVLRLLHIVPRSWLVQNVYTSAAIAICLFVVFLAGNIHYYNKAREEISLTTTKQLHRDVRLVMASDLHLGYHNPRRELARWVDLINAEQPDMVLIAGDIIDMSLRPLLEEDMAAELRRISAPVYACLGNHEYYSGEPRAQQFFRDANINLLRDSGTVAGGLLLVGRDDRTNRHRRPLRQIMEGLPQADSLFTILLDHQPHHLEEAEQAAIDLQLSGHTHHGQVWPASWVTDALYECAFGSHQRGATHYYVSSGLGIWGGKFRIGTRSEYVVVHIRSSFI